MIDIQIYSKGKNIFYRQNMHWKQAHAWLYEKESKNKEFDKIDIQLHSSQDMPVDDVEDLITFNAAHTWIATSLTKAKNGYYDFILNPHKGH